MTRSSGQPCPDLEALPARFIDRAYRHAWFAKPASTLYERPIVHSADQAPKGRVRGVELLDLLDRGAAAEAGEAADQLQVDQVAGGSESGSPRPNRPRHCTVQGPISGIAEQAASAAGPPSHSGRAAISRATARRAIERAGERSIEASSAGARPAIVSARRGRRAAPRARRPGAGPSGRRCGAGSRRPARSRSAA